MLIEPLVDADVPQSLRGYGAIATSTNMVIHGLGRCPEILTGWGRLTFGFDVVNDTESHLYEVP